MVHWRPVRDALVPTENSVVPDGVWSGGAALDKNGVPVLFFTAGNDSFRKEGEAVLEIGNNVTLSFTDMEFERAGKMRLILDGATELETSTVSLRIAGPDGENAVSSCVFHKSERAEQAFEVSVPQGLCTVSFVFLPGSKFDFYGFRFVLNE